MRQSRSVGKWRPIELVFGPQAAHERISQRASIGIDESGMRNRWHQDAPQAPAGKVAPE